MELNYATDINHAFKNFTSTFLGNVIECIPEETIVTRPRDNYGLIQFYVEKFVFEIVYGESTKIKYIKRFTEISKSKK